jgi:uncharacterized phage protein (TIGR02220 family)
MKGFTYVGKLSNSFICDKRLSQFDFRVFFIILKWDTWDKPVTIEKMADEIGISTKSFGRSVKKLEELKYIKVARNTNWETYKYSIHRTAHKNERPVDKNESPLIEGNESPLLIRKSNNKEIYKESEGEKNTAADKIPYQKIIDYLNKVASKNFKAVGKTKTLIAARWNEGHTVDDFIKVIDICWGKVKNNTYDKKYMRPSTLFNGAFNERTQWEAPKSNLTQAEAAELGTGEVTKYDPQKLIDENRARNTKVSTQTVEESFDKAIFQ